MGTKAHGPDRREQSARYYALNRDDILRRARERRAAEDPALKAARNREYQARHPERIAEERRRYAAAHREDRARASREYRAAHPQEIAARKQRWYQEHKAESDTRKRAWVDRNRRRIRDARLRALYGIGIEDYERLLDEQAGVCAICGGPPLGRWGWFHVDHDHRTGTVRGLLCDGCNLGLGKFGDNPDTLRSAAEYLARTMVAEARSSLTTEEA